MPMPFLPPKGIFGLILSSCKVIYWKTIDMMQTITLPIAVCTELRKMKRDRRRTKKDSKGRRDSKK